MPSCLNPYCCGQQTSTVIPELETKAVTGLNPYCCGQQTSTYGIAVHDLDEACLNPYCCGQQTSTNRVMYIERKVRVS